jgi:hypothetical protein
MQLALVFLLKFAERDDDGVDDVVFVGWACGDGMDSPPGPPTPLPRSAHQSRDLR